MIMKKVYIFIFFACIGTAAFGQCSVLVNSFTNVTCNGECDGSVNLSSLGLPPFTYSWAPGGQTVQNPADLCPGTHTVTMIDANSCQSTATVTITEPAVLTTAIATTDVSCNGDCDGSATATPSGGTQPYTFQWDSATGNQITSVATNLCPGIYSVVVTDANGCTTMGQAVITEPAVLTVTTSSVATSCQACTDGSATAFPSGGTPSYSYFWSPSAQTGQTASNLGGGDYTVTVTDAQGCTAMDTVTVQSPTGIISEDAGISVNVYPNPITDVANIEITSGPADAILFITLFDVTGKMVSSRQENAGRTDVVRMNFENLPPGAYLMEIRVNDAKMTVKVFRK